MKLNAMRDVGALVRSARRNQGLTQAELAALVSVGREWVVRLEGGSPRVEAQKVLDALSALGLVLNVTPSNPSAALRSMQPAPAEKTGTTSKQRRTGTAVKASRKTETSTRVTKSGPSGRWVVDKTSGAARPNRSAQDPFDALFSQKGR